MHSVVPDAKLIYVVRDPLERIAAHWVHNYAKRREKGDLRATLTHANTSYVVRSQYHMQLQQFLAALPADADARDRAGGAPHRARGDAPEGLRVRRRGSGLPATLTSASSAMRPRARRAPAAGRAAGTAGEPHARGRVLPKNVWLAVDERLARRRPIERPDVRLALGPDVLRSCARTPRGSGS